jgi:hypothetical protein
MSYNPRRRRSEEEENKILVVQRQNFLTIFRYGTIRNKNAHFLDFFVPFPKFARSRLSNEQCSTKQKSLKKLVSQNKPELAQKLFLVNANKQTNNASNPKFAQKLFVKHKPNTKSKLRETAGKQDRRD